MGNEQYVVDTLADKFVIVDRNTDQLVKGRAQPNGNSKFVWKTDSAVIAQQCCDALNKSVKRPNAERGSGPHEAIKDVDPFVIGAAIARKTGSLSMQSTPPPRFTKCETCQNMVKEGHNCE